MTSLIGIRGLAGHGKDAVANLIVDYLPGVLTQRLWFAEPLKEITALVTGLTVEDIQRDKGRYLPDYNMTVRALMQRIGTEAMRNQVHPDIWIRIAERRLASMGPGTRIVTVIPDVRFANEVRFIRSRGGIILSVYRPGAGECMDHESERGQLSMGDTVDHEIINDGSLEDLRTKVYRLMGALFPTYSAPW